MTSSWTPTWEPISKAEWEEYGQPLALRLRVQEEAQAQEAEDDDDEEEDDTAFSPSSHPIPWYIPTLTTYETTTTFSTSQSSPLSIPTQRTTNCSQQCR